jgi:glyoxylase-like metal-dependent hydrolase (beta-lactamase superfamily II)
MRMYGFNHRVPALKTLGCTALAVWALGGAAHAWAQAAPVAAATRVAPAAPAVEPVQVVPGVWMVQGASALGSPANRNFISNAAFVVTSAGVVVVDALGSPVLAQELIAAIARVTPLPIVQVIVTHYHADHIYGLQAFKALGVTITAHSDGQAYLHSDTARLRLQASREELAPWIDAQTQLVAADRWVSTTTRFSLGGVDFVLQPAGPAHTPEDLVVVLPQQGVLIAGDLVFRGRIPFVGQADSGRWIDALQRLMAFQARTIVPGHGPASASAESDLALTRDYLVHLRQTMGEAALNLEPFEEAYAKADWSRFEHLPLFRAANRINAYNTYLLMEQSAK